MKRDFTYDKCIFSNTFFPAQEGHWPLPSRTLPELALAQHLRRLLCPRDRHLLLT